MNGEDVKQTASSAGQTNTGSAPVAPVSGSINKEAEPVSPTEYTMPSTPEFELSKEVEEAVREVLPVRPQITGFDRTTGMELAKESKRHPLIGMKLPNVTPEELANMKSRPPTESPRWLGTLIEFVRKRFGG